MRRASSGSSCSLGSSKPRGRHGTLGQELKLDPAWVAAESRNLRYILPHSFSPRDSREREYGFRFSGRRVSSRTDDVPSCGPHRLWDSSPWLLASVCRLLCMYSSNKRDREDAEESFQNANEDDFTEKDGDSPQGFRRVGYEDNQCLEQNRDFRYVS